MADTNTFDTVISALKQKIAIQQTVDNEKHKAFEVVTTKWHELVKEANTILQGFSGVEDEGHEDLARLKEIVLHLFSNIETVAQIGLNSLPDAVKEPLADPNSPAASPALTTPVTPESIKVSENGTVTTDAQNAADVVDMAAELSKKALETVVEQQKTSIEPEPENKEKEPETGNSEVSEP